MTKFYVKEAFTVNPLSCAKRNTPQGVAMERRNVMESRSRPKWLHHFGMPLGAVASGDWGLENMTKFYVKEAREGFFYIKFCQVEIFYYLCTPYVE